MSSKTARANRILVVSVDRDDDIGSKAKIPTPIVGREECVAAGSKLALADPEEADANTIFAAVKQFDELAAKGQASQVAVVSGAFEGGVEADQKVREQIMKVTATYNADGLVLVSDGPEDEQVLPIIQSIIPVISVRRLFIKQSRTVEESYAVLGRYLRMLVFDPRYSRFFLGVPGLLLLVTGLLIYLNLFGLAAAFSLGIIGIALIVRGFDLDKLAAALTRLKPSYYVRLFSALASVLLIAAGIYLGFAGISITEEFDRVIADPPLFLKYAPFLIGVFIKQCINLIWIGLAINFAGALLFHLFRHSIRMFRDSVILLMLTLLYLPVSEFSSILRGEGNPGTLVSFLLIGLAATFLAVAFVYQRLQTRRSLAAVN